MGAFFDTLEALAAVQTLSILLPMATGLVLAVRWESEISHARDRMAQRVPTHVEPYDWQREGL